MKPRVGIFGLSGCWGEQIVILNCEDELLDIVQAVDIVDFLGGSSVNDTSGPIDIAFVEGSVGSNKEEATIKKIRERAKYVVACGSCACFGGISAMDGDRPREEMARLVYGDKAPQYDTHPHRPISDYVTVDLAIPGCPMEKEEFVKAVANLLNGNPPILPNYAVCTECKWKDRDCLLISRKLNCAGPVTRAGCGARCPGYNIPCVSCRGPLEDANLDSMKDILAESGITEQDIRRRLRNFAAPLVDKIEGERA